MSIKTLENVLKIQEKKVKTEKEKQKRVITGETKWSFNEDELTYANQLILINQIYNNKIENKPHCALIKSQINGKISGYRGQDIDKDKYNENLFIDEDYVIEQLINCSNKCYYCRGPVSILYEYVRAPQQWSLDRLDNKFGHNKGNCVIACLSCNLRRKTMHHERYVFTKQIDIKKID
uniref:HNH endonuclease n=1 Tax=viral metagenome TaxID=1070528 RepID=A0A6C0B751_9ZZZZ